MNTKRPNYNIEKQKLAEGFKFVIGCDEVGRGCLAGPVVAAAVILNNSKVNLKSYREINDSKVLSPEKRSILAEMIRAEAIAFGIGVVTPKKIDEINIHKASLLAMNQAIKNLSRNSKGYDSYGTGSSLAVLVDGKFTIPNLDLDQTAIINGDALVLSIAAASIVAKVYRDELMVKLGKKFPMYEFSRHKGYATEIHRTAIQQHGLSSVHRLTFCGNIV